MTALLVRQRLVETLMKSTRPCSPNVAAGSERTLAEVARVLKDETLLDEDLEAIAGRGPEDLPACELLPRLQSPI
jgi:hypothetical protein